MAMLGRLVGCLVLAVGHGVQRAHFNVSAIFEVASPSSKRVVGRKKSVYCKTVQERRDEIANHLICHDEEDADSPKKVRFEFSV